MLPKEHFDMAAVLRGTLTKREGISNLMHFIIYVCRVLTPHHILDEHSNIKTTEPAELALIYVRENTVQQGSFSPATAHEVPFS